MQDNPMILPNVRTWQEDGQTFIQYDEGVLHYEVHTHGDFPQEIENGGEMTSRANAIDEIQHYKDFFRAVDSACVFRLDGSIRIKIIGEKYIITGYFRPYAVIERDRKLLLLAITSGTWVAY